MAIKRFDVSITVWGRVKAGTFFEGIEADSDVSAINRAVSKTCASGMYSPRICALLKETAKKYGRSNAGAYGAFRGVEVVEWAIESRDKSKNENKNENE